MRNVQKGNHLHPHTTSTAPTFMKLAITQQDRQCTYRGVDKSLARPGMKQARKHVRDVRDFNNIETQAVKLFFLQGKAPKEILTETLVCFLPGRAKDLPAPLITYKKARSCNHCCHGKAIILHILSDYLYP